MARIPFDQQEYTLEGAASLRSREENTGNRQEWKPQAGNRTKEVGGWGGQGYYYENGPNGQPYAVPGSRMSDEDVARYRALGAQHRDAVQLDLSQANDARGLQLGSLAMMSGAARGNAPSRAAELGRTASDTAALNAARGSVGHGPQTGLSAMRGAMMGQSAQAGQSAQQIGEMRAQEMGRARGDYFGGASGVRRQDIGSAVSNAQLEAANRDLEQKRRQQMEKLAFDTRNAELYGGVEQRRQEDEAWLSEQKAKAAKSEADHQTMMDWIGMGAAAMGGAMSDQRTKHVVTYGSLAGIHRRK